MKDVNSLLLDKQNNIPKHQRVAGTSQFATLSIHFYPNSSLAQSSLCKHTYRLPGNGTDHYMASWAVNMCVGSISASHFVHNLSLLLLHWLLEDVDFTIS
jgi:hypothetical protein